MSENPYWHDAKQIGLIGIATYVLYLAGFACGVIAGMAWQLSTWMLQ